MKQFSSKIFMIDIIEIVVGYLKKKEGKSRIEYYEGYFPVHAPIKMSTFLTSTCE